MEPEELMAMAKRKLRIDVGDAADDERIEEMLASAMADLSDALALPEGFDFKEPGKERDLLLARIFYEWNDALDDFEANYATMMATVREKWIARCHAEAIKADADLQ